MRTENAACGEDSATVDCAPADGAQSDHARETQPAPAPVQSGFLAHPRRELTRWAFDARALFIRTLARTGVSSAPATAAFEAHLTTVRAAVEAERAQLDHEASEVASTLANACIELANADQELNIARLANEALHRELKRAEANNAMLRDSLYIAQQQLLENKGR